METRWILGLCILWVAKSECTVIETVTLTDNECGNTYMLSNTPRYLEWDGAHIGRDSFINLRNGFISTKDSGSCKVSFEPGGTSSLKVCITVEEFYIEDCNTTVNYYHHDDYERKATYGCNTTPTSFCWKGNGVEVEIAYKGKSPPGSSNYFKLKITQYEKEDWLTLIILAPFVGVTVIVAIIMAVVCRRKRSKGVVFRNSEIPHSRLVNEPADPTQPSLGYNSAYPMNQPATREFTVTVPVAVNVG